MKSITITIYNDSKEAFEIHMIVVYYLVYLKGLQNAMGYLYDQIYVKSKVMHIQLFFVWEIIMVQM